LDDGPAIYDSAAQLPDRYQRDKQNLALRRVCQRRYHTAELDGNLHVCTGESHANADRDSDGNSHSDSYANRDSNGYAYTDSNANGDSNGYAHTDSNANGDSDSYAYTHSYAYVDTNNPAETKPDTKAAPDAAASSVGPSLKPASPWPWARRVITVASPERFRGAQAPRDFHTKVLWECDASSHRFQSRSKSRKRREDAHALRRSGSYRTKRQASERFLACRRLGEGGNVSAQSRGACRIRG